MNEKNGIMAENETGGLSKETLEKFRSLPDLDASVKNAITTIVTSGAMDDGMAKEVLNGLNVALEQRKALAGPNGRVLVTDSELNPGDVLREMHPKSAEMDFRVAAGLESVALISSANGNPAALNALSELAQKGGLSSDQISKDMAAIEKANKLFENEPTLSFEEGKLREPVKVEAGFRAFAEVADAAAYAIDSNADRHQPLNSKLTAIFMSSMEYGGKPPAHGLSAGNPPAKNEPNR